MKPLRRSIQSSLHNFEPPESDQEFEDICRDLFELILKSRAVGIHNKISPGYITYKGASGDKQFGFDVRCKTSLAVAQCKLVKDLYPGDLDDELIKLKKYKGVVSHYFFLISNDRVKASLQDWVDDRNKETEEQVGKDKRFPVEPGVRLPWFHIMGWTEIKNYLLESTLLSLKWGALQGAVNKFYYLPGFDAEKLESAIDNIRHGRVGQPCSMSISGGRSLTDRLEVADISRIGQESKIHISTLDGICEFVGLYDENLRIAKTHRVALQKLDSEDLIVFEEGLSELNTLAYHSARICALQYLKQAYHAARALKDMLMLDEDHFSAEVMVEDYDIGVSEISTGYLLFNFDAPDEIHPPWYINPQSAQESASRLVNEIQKFRSLTVG